MDWIDFLLVFLGVVLKIFVFLVKVMLWTIALPFILIALLFGVRIL